MHPSVNLEDDLVEFKVESGLKEMVVGTRLLCDCTLTLITPYTWGEHANATDACIFFCDVLPQKEYHKKDNLEKND